MQEILSELDDIAGKVERLESKRKRLGNFLQEVKDEEIEGEKIPEKKISIEVEEGDLSGGSICGIDGGLLKKSYHAVDLVLTKAVAVVFDFNDGLENVSYYPSSLPTPKLSVFTEPLSREDFSLAANLERMEIEADIALKTMNRKDLSLLLMDGSIVPHPSTNPSEDSDVKEKFEDVLETYGEILNSPPCLLAGVSEDSRSRKFSKIVSDDILEKVKSEKKKNLKDILKGTRDTNLLFYVLKQGERTSYFRYCDDFEKSYLPKNILENIYSFYLKATEYDRPLRVDFYASGDPTETADMIASKLLSLSADNEEYAIPTVLIEADKRASLKEEELQFIYSSLQDKVGDVPSLYKLRRDERPF
ncbi:MAG: DNA double-strand break repair nuclease NurA [Candidatus Aenigmatarchaeota archaeon]